MILEELREKLTAYGLESYSAELEQSARPCVRLYLNKADEKEIPLGASKMGGRPDLPPSIDWPYETARQPDHRNTYFKQKSEPTPLLPLSFVAQINLCEVSPCDNEKLLPESGILYFFYSAEQDVWGFAPQDHSGFRVLFYEGSTSELSRSGFPDDLPDYSRFSPCSLTPKAELSFPDYGDSSVPVFETDHQSDMYYEHIVGDSIMNQMLGHPNTIQGQMEIECELVTNGIDTGDGLAYRNLKDETQQKACAWRLLLQVDSNDDCGMMWGDVGRLYFWIRKQDLAAKQFDQCWMILQCS
jgi:uncharacterized protein YwqG